jgi:hypothetical protein
VPIARKGQGPTVKAHVKESLIKTIDLERLLCIIPVHRHRIRQIKLHTNILSLHIFGQPHRMSCIHRCCNSKNLRKLKSNKNSPFSTMFAVPSNPFMSLDAEGAGKYRGGWCIVFEVEMYHIRRHLEHFLQDEILGDHLGPRHKFRTISSTYSRLTLAHRHRVQ